MVIADYANNLALRVLRQIPRTQQGRLSALAPVPRIMSNGEYIIKGTL
jgi:hypothetical protein